MIQIGGVYTTFLPGGGHTFAKVCHRNGRCIAILFKSIGVRGRFDFPELRTSKREMNIKTRRSHTSDEAYANHLHASGVCQTEVLPTSRNKCDKTGQPAAVS